MKPTLRWKVVMVVLITALSFSSSAQADGDEGPVAFAYGIGMLGGFGLPALGLDITNIVFISRGPSPSVSRRVVGILSIASGVGLLLAGTLAVTTGLSSHWQRSLNILGAIDYTLGAATIGLGIGTLLRYKKPAVAFTPLMIADLHGDTSPGVGMGFVF